MNFRILVRILTRGNSDKIRLLYTRSRTFELPITDLDTDSGKLGQNPRESNLWSSDCYLGCASHHGTYKKGRRDLVVKLRVKNSFQTCTLLFSFLEKAVVETWLWLRGTGGGLSWSKLGQEKMRSRYNLFDSVLLLSSYAGRLHRYAEL